MTKQEIRKNLEERAKVFGLKYIGVSTDNLKIAVEEAEAKGQDAPNTPIETPTTPVKPTVAKEEKVEKIKVEKEEKPVVKEGKYNVAIVKVHGNEVRRYTLTSHGKDFARLAEEFASDRVGAEVEYLTYEKGITCPACGHEFHQ